MTPKYVSSITTAGHRCYFAPFEMNSWIELKLLCSLSRRLAAAWNFSTHRSKLTDTWYFLFSSVEWVALLLFAVSLLSAAGIRKPTICCCCCTAGGAGNACCCPIKLLLLLWLATMAPATPFPPSAIRLYGTWAIYGWWCGPAPAAAANELPLLLFVLLLELLWP